jgi:membrane protein implicated in regulation of membrane protease activity
VHAGAAVVSLLLLLLLLQLLLLLLLQLLLLLLLQRVIRSRGARRGPSRVWVEAEEGVGADADETVVGAGWAVVPLLL